MTIRIDPEFRDLIPPLRPDERAQLEANIAAEGVRDPLVVWQGTLLDGHNRYEIATRLGLPYQTVEREFESRNHAVLWIVQNQLGRRNLYPAARVDLGMRIEPILAEQAKARQVAAGEQYGRGHEKVPPNLAEPFEGDVNAGETITQAAEAVGMKRESYRKARVVLTQAPASIRDAFRANEISTHEAYQKVRKEQRAQEIKEQRATIAQKAQVVQPSHRYRVYHADAAVFTLPEPVDVIITDPPYPREFLPCWSVLAQRATEWLKPGGIVVAMSGQAYLDQVYAMMSEHLDYYWTASYQLPGQPTPLRHVNVNTSWKPLLIYTRRGEKYTGKIFGDVMASDRNEKDFHKWGQSVSGMDAILERFALPGQTVFDPFCGAGTTGVAALRRKCLFVGCDIQLENVEISISRMAEVFND